MTSKPVAPLLADLGVTKSHSRPHVSNDNPFSKAQFKTMKVRPDVPDRFGSLEHGRSHCGDFFPWYNIEHHHVGLGLFTPHDVHYGLAAAKREQRARVLAVAFARHPGRFPNGPPSPRPLPTAVWTNPPKVPAVAEEVANPMTLESDAAALGAVRASCDADVEHERPGILSGSFSGFGREESAERAAGGRAARARATLPPARSVSAYRVNAMGAKCSGKAQSWEVRDERLDWPDPELTHIRLHRTIYDSLGGLDRACL